MTTLDLYHCLYSNINDSIIITLDNTIDDIWDRWPFGRLHYEVEIRKCLSLRKSDYVSKEMRFYIRKYNIDTTAYEGQYANRDLFLNHWRINLSGFRPNL